MFHLNSHNWTYFSFTCTDVFGHFRKGDEFFGFAGQSTQAVTGIYNLYRASHISFPEEKILEDANEFSSKFLREKRACNELLDKWIVTKDLPGEVRKYSEFNENIYSRIKSSSIPVR